MNNLINILIVIILIVASNIATYIIARRISRPYVVGKITVEPRDDRSGETDVHLHCEVTLRELTDHEFVIFKVEAPSTFSE